MSYSQGSDATVALWSRSDQWPKAAAARNIVRRAWPNYDVKHRNIRLLYFTVYSTWPTCSITRPRPPRSNCPSASGSSCRRSRPLCTRWPPTVSQRNLTCLIRNRCRWPPLAPPPRRPRLLPTWRTRPPRARRSNHRRRRPNRTIKPLLDIAR